jgi:hypothetical protein
MWSIFMWSERMNELADTNAKPAPLFSSFLSLAEPERRAEETRAKERVCYLSINGLHGPGEFMPGSLFPESLRDHLLVCVQLIHCFVSSFTGNKRRKKKKKGVSMWRYMYVCAA